MDEKKGFTFFISYWEAIEELPEKDQLAILKAIIKYAFFGEIPNDLKGVKRSVFLLIKPTLDKSRKRAASGKQGGSKSKAKGKQTGRDKDEDKDEDKGLGGGEGGKPRSDGSLFTVFWNAYPEIARNGREDAWEAWKKLNPSQEDADRIMDHLKAWKESKRWMDDGGAFIPNPKNFLAPERGYMRTKPAPAEQELPKGASGQLGEAELEAIQKVLREQEGNL